jgi:undecaprenyl-diphosphatase
MDLFEAVVLGVVEGLTEFLPISSTGHLTIFEKLLGLPIDAEEITAYTAVIQVGAILAVLVYFRTDIWRMTHAWALGLFKPEYRGTFDHRFGWYVIVGSIPIVIVALAGRSLITGPLRNLWWIAGSLILWSAVLVLAEYVATQKRGERDMTMRDTLIIGTAQCIALIPGVSRSGATISAGLMLGLDRVTATRMSFFLSIPALVGAGAYELPEAINGGIGAAEMLVGTVVSFFVAYAAVAWLLKFVAGHSLALFVWYRVALGGLLVVLLATGVMSPT